MDVALPRRAAANPKRSPLPMRRLLLAVAAAMALTGVLAGLARVGVLSAWGAPVAAHHGPVWVLGVFLTVIALERAVALGKRWAAWAPMLSAVSGVALLAGLPGAAYGAVLAAALLVAVNTAIVARQRAHFTLLMLLGTVALLGGTVAWSVGAPVYRAVPPWIGFFVLTIVAERLELSRLSPTPRWASWMLIASSLLLAAGLGLGLLWPTALRGAGILLMLIGAWQMRFDVARRTLRQGGLPRYGAIGVLTGAFWLTATGALLLAYRLPPAGPIYDAVLHGVFVGYVLSMVFAHAPIILPAVARIQVAFTPWLYLPLVSLHAGLAARVLGDLTGSFSLRQGGSVINAIALGLFVIVVALHRRRARAAAP